MVLSNRRGVTGRGDLGMNDSVFVSGSAASRCAAALAAMREAGNTQAADICSRKVD